MIYFGVLNQRKYFRKFLRNKEYLPLNKSRSLPSVESSIHTCIFGFGKKFRGKHAVSLIFQKARSFSDSILSPCFSEKYEYQFPVGLRLKLYGFRTCGLVAGLKANGPRSFYS
ncbi:hypothetical protein DLM78_06930 [Leptospira stimsonii]|uniref:Uncharacterized protein n=1 Tax=Leptospira stimsonii TaxID=2202203 RepID=A0A8B3CVG8_9LEPT|nr:hypothetical protein DLM78_06930 [Leptospira stimsonii]